MKEYVAVWHIGEVTRGEIIRLSDEDAEKLLAKGAIVPARVPGGKAPVESEPEDDEPDVEPDVEQETGDEIEDGDGNEAEDESEADEDAEAPEIDALDAIGEAEPEPEKPAKKPRKTTKKEG